MRTPQTPDAALDSELQLVEACRRGDLSAFEQLYVRHGARMKSIALNMLGNVSDAEDSVQEAFLKIYRGLPNFKGESAFSTWIYRVLVNACYDSMRRRRRRQETADLAAVGDPMKRAVAPADTDHPLRLTLEKHLARIEPRPRAVFLLFEVEGFTHREIAEVLNIREGTSKSLLFETKRELQRMLTAPPQIVKSEAS